MKDRATPPPINAERQRESIMTLSDKIRKEQRTHVYFAAVLITFMLLCVVVAVVAHGPFVLGTECRTAGRTGDHLYLGAIDCAAIETAGG